MNAVAARCCLRKLLGRWESRFVVGGKRRQMYTGKQLASSMMRNVP
ncbi:hypothetical protein [Collimonas silvisoli]|nr:hypothetical protein [Collimonas silvisoli]